MKPNVTAIVYDKKGNILSVGRNSYIKTHPVQAKAAKAVGQPKRIYLHAEIHAIVQLREWKDAYAMRVIRLGANGKELLSKPCPVCMHVIKQTGIKRIEHT